MTRLNMKMAENWGHEEELKGFIAHNLKKSRLSLVLGAGISSAFGLPDWCTLLNDLAEGIELPSDYLELPPSKKAAFITSKKYSKNENAFKIALKKRLYSKASVDFEDLQRNETLAAIGAMVMASSRGSISKVINFNFDNILELYLEYYGFTVNCQSNGTDWTSNKDVSIFHPHGILPYNQDSNSDCITIDNSGFHKILASDSPWRNRIFHTLSSSIVIFIGVSGNDDHLEHHLQECREKHVACAEGFPYWGIWFTTDASSANATIWRNHHIFPVELNSWDHLPKWLFTVCQKSAATT